MDNMVILSKIINVFKIIKLENYGTNKEDLYVNVE